MGYFHRLYSSSLLLFFILVSSVFVFPAALVGAIGINYGQIGNNLPSPENVFPLVRSINATKLKLYDADPRVLKAFANTGIEFIVGLGNECLATMRDPDKAQAWVKTNIQAYLPATKISCISVGNEVLTFNDTSLRSHLLPAMQNIHAALVNLNLDKQVIVTTTHSLAILEVSYPPSAGVFGRDLRGYVSQILNFLAKTGSPFLINAYPYFAYESNPNKSRSILFCFNPTPGLWIPCRIFTTATCCSLRSTQSTLLLLRWVQETVSTDLRNGLAVEGRRRRSGSESGEREELQRQSDEAHCSEEGDAFEAGLRPQHLRVCSVQWEPEARVEVAEEPRTHTHTHTQRKNHCIKKSF